ncbi:efflux RND transporter periplasmic adaptor subunit [Chloroflexota bacterium]
MNIVRILKIVVAILALGMLTFLLVGCGSESDEAAASESQVITVQRGDLAIDITAVGNLALSLKEDLALEISGTEQDPLTVEEVLVEEGDSVEEGQVLVTLDTTALEEKVTSRALTVRLEEIDLQAAKDAEQTVRAAEIDLETATNNYRKEVYPYTSSTFAYHIPEAIEAIHDAELQLEKVRPGIGAASGTTEYAEAWHQLTLAQENLAEAREKLSRGQGLSAFVGDDPFVAAKDYWTARALQLSLEKAQGSLDKARNNFQISLEKAEIALEEARDDLEDAKDELGKAVIMAPFDGFITQVNVEGGDEVKKGMVAVQIADPNQFEAEVMVGEMDILQVELGGEASVQVDAMQGLVLPANITHISPTATIQSGVVNYKVKVEIESLEAVTQERQQARQEARQSIEQGELPEGLKQAVEEGRITQKQAEEMMKQRQPGQGGHQGQMPAMIPANFQLREGLTVTVSILVDERNDVLLVLNTAITHRGMETLVQVSKDDAIEERSIQTGISDWQYTEVIDGLSEGEKVVVPQGTPGMTETTQNERPSGGIRIPGMGSHP